MASESVIDINNQTANALKVVDVNTCETKLDQLMKTGLTFD